MGQPSSGYWEERTSHDFAGLDPERVVALLPVGAVEQHGPHLPLGTDSLIGRGIVSRVLELLPEEPAVLVLPALPVGASAEHADFPGTLSVEAETLIGLWTELGRSVARAGVRKLVFFNTHGGQTALLDIVAVRLRRELGMLAVKASYFAFGVGKGLFADAELAHGIHGGALETSLMLQLRPELVRRGAIARFPGLPEEMAAEYGLLGPERPVGFGWLSQDLHAQGVCGDAAAGSPEAGRELVEQAARALVSLLLEVGRFPLTRLRSG